jgi:hypothetical protein
VCTVLRTVVLGFFFSCWSLEFPSDNCIRHVPMWVHYHAQGLRLETFQNVYVRCGGRTPELYSIGYVQMGLSIVLYKRSFLFVECFDLRPSNQCILVRVIPSCFHLTKMCLCQVSLLSRCSPRYSLELYHSKLLVSRLSVFHNKVPKNIKQTGNNKFEKELKNL